MTPALYFAGQVRKHLSPGQMGNIGPIVDPEEVAKISFWGKGKHSPILLQNKSPIKSLPDLDR